MLSHSGDEDGVYGDIPSQATFKIRGDGDVTIMGSIGEGAQIDKSGDGDLTISGKVGENVTFIISGDGDVEFNYRPPQSVINRIKKRGDGDLTIPGGMGQNAKKQSHSSAFSSRVSVSGCNGSTVIVSDGDLNISTVGNPYQSYPSAPSSHVNISGAVNSVVMVAGRNINGSASAAGSVYQSYPSASSSYVSISGAGGVVMVAGGKINGGASAAAYPGVFSAAASAPRSVNSSAVFGNMSGRSVSSVVAKELKDHKKDLPKAKLEKDDKSSSSKLNGYSKTTEAYITYANKLKKVSQLKITDEESKQFHDELRDPITFNVMDVPVRLNGNVYNLQTLLDIKPVAGEMRVDPFTTEEFYLRDIQPARDILDKIQDKITVIEEDRKKALSNAAKDSEVIALGGQSMMNLG